MARGSAPGEYRGGRQRGTLNKATLEKLAVAAQTIDSARRGETELAKDVLERMMKLAEGAAGVNRPVTAADVAAGRQQNPEGSWERFGEWFDRTVYCAKELAKYQSPTFKAIVGPFAPAGPGTERTLELAPNAPAGENVRALSEDPEVLQQIYRRRIAQVG